MNGPVNVLAWLDSLHATTADGAVTNRKWPEAQEARAAVAELIERDERSERLIEVLRHERDHARRCYDGAVKTLAGIHALLYPPPHTNAEGVTFVFHSPHVHEQMQALSDRIRAIPNEISTIGSAK